jgi:hypothetical protein
MMEIENIVLNTQTQLTHWHQESETSFTGTNQEKVYYEFELNSPASAQEENVLFKVFSFLEVLNQYRGVIVNVKTQTDFTLKNGGQKPAIASLFECIETASREFNRILQEKMVGTHLADLRVKRPEFAEVEQRLSHSLHAQYG